MSNEIPRRSRIDRFTPAEKAIWDAVQAVEAAGAHPDLTAALNLLHEARHHVANFVDGQNCSPPKGDSPPLAGTEEGTK